MVFDRPPLNEVVLSLQSEPVRGLTTPFLGLFWNRIRRDYPEVQTYPALDPVVERFDRTPKAAEAPPFRVLESAETPRCWFVMPSGQQLIQLQQDRLILNWRRVEPSDVYPRYSQLRPELERIATELIAFAGEEQLGTFRPTQCEVSYINHIDASDWTTRGELDRVLSFWRPMRATGFAEPEDANTSFRFVMEDCGVKVGRLHVAVKSAIRRSDEKPVLVLDLTARGTPASPDIGGALEFLDLGREWIHRAFRSLTSKEAQRELWGLRDE